MSFTAIVKPNPEEYASVPEMRLRGDDLTRMLGLYAADAEIQTACRDGNVERRMRLIPHGWRDLRLCQALIGRLTDAIQWTVPRDKRVGFARTAERCRYVVMQGPLAVKPRPNEEEIITTKELDELVSSAWEGRCRMCVDGNCDRCDLGRVLDGLVAQDRAGGSWGMMDIRRKA